jgi:choline dehydrogenase
MTETFDHIVVGGGTAGCVIAARLSEDPDTRVLLLEAGAADPLPAMADPAAWWTLSGTSVDWAYQTVPQPGTASAAHHWPRGKVLGGSSAINALMHVRGDRFGYDVWEAAGATGWNYETLLPFFKRSERVLGRDARYRGLDGPMIIDSGAPHHPLWEACFRAAVEVGYPANLDGNGASAEGTSWGEYNVVRGLRQSAADGYLRPSITRPNLTVVTGAHVRRLTVSLGRCRGAEYVADGVLRAAAADREVILTAGAVGTPQLLMLSGVGPAQHLRDLGIDVAADVPGVGANLHDHPKSQVAYTAPRRVLPGYTRKPHVLFRSQPAAAPDLQVIFVEKPVRPRWELGPEDGYSVVFALMIPASRGTIRLASADPDQPPLIDPAYLTDPHDVERMLTGLRAAREIGTADALAPYRDKELFPGPAAWTDAALRAYLTHTVSTYFHPAGTCKIGIDAMSVVGPELRVHGVDGLRIADASVMPTPVSANTNATVLAIAERAASMLRAGGQES